MAQVANYTIPNGTGQAVRTDIDATFLASVSQNSGSTDTAMTVKYPYMFWADTNTGKLKIRNAANNGWVEVGTLATANLGNVVAASPTMTGDVTCSSTGFIKIPVGTTAQRSGSPAVGQFRWNSTLGKAEIYDGSAFSEVGGGAGATGGDNGDNAVFWENQQAVTHDYSITASRNAGSFGPITINASKTITIPSGCIWSIL